MADERSAKILLGGKEYELLLTTRATKEIAKKYGGLGNLGEKLAQSENFEGMILVHCFLGYKKVVVCQRV